MNFNPPVMMTLMYAAEFAAQRHGAQVRKYTGEPYIVHCFSVAKTLAMYGVGEPCLTAAILHDVIEDTQTSYEEIRDNFGSVMADLVLELTDPPLSAGNRAKRKEMSRERLHTASYYAKTIKCADIMDNMDSIIKYDPNFSKVFLREIRELYPLLSGADNVIYAALDLKLSGVA